MRGVLRPEWIQARFGQTIPHGWTQNDISEWIQQCSPIGLETIDARNIIATKFIEEGAEWLFLNDHDVLLPPRALLRLNERMMRNRVPVWSGLYFTKTFPSQPIVYRGHGNSFFTNWKLGESVWVDGLPLGCTMIHRDILRVMYEESEDYEINDIKAKRIFPTPEKAWYDPRKLCWFSSEGSEDLAWCLRVMKEEVFKKAGWHKYADMEYPFMIDTNLFCKSIDFNGLRYPLISEAQQFSTKYRSKFHHIESDLSKTESNSSSINQAKNGRGFVS
jgi:hypothetical protein